MINEEKKHLDDVYGISRDVPLTYVERDAVDKKFIGNLSRKKHIVLYGGSKQGKTCLRKHSLQEDDCITVQCGGTINRADIYRMVLKEAGASIDVLEKRTTKGNAKLGVTLGWKAKLPFIGGAKAAAQGEISGERGVERETRYFEIDPEDPNDIIRILGDLEFDQYIILEDFHYLAIEVQREIAIDLKAFHEKSNICFIVVGVWLEQNRLVLYNGDLVGRVVSVEADEWNGEDLSRVIRVGEQLLNIKFPEKVKAGLIAACQGNVGLLQEACHLICERCGIISTQENLREIGNVGMLDDVVRQIACDQDGRYRNFITEFSQGFRSSQNQMYRWLIACVIAASVADLKAGLRHVELLQRMKLSHGNSKKLQIGNVVQALKNIGRLQQQKRIQPVILDFNESENRLRVVDAGLILFLTSKDKVELLDLIGMMLK